MANQLLLLQTPCGCPELSYPDVALLEIIDWDRLLSGENGIEALKIENTIEVIDQTFFPLTDLVTYLNTIFAPALGLDGNFYINGTYSNPEGFTSMEIMSVREKKTLVFVVGTPPVLPNVAYTVVANGNVITDVRINGAVTAIRVGNGNIEPLNTNGWYQNPAILQTVNFNGGDLSINDSNVYIEFTQTT